MKKNIYFFVILFFFSFMSINAQDYYYYKGEKQYLTLDKTRLDITVSSNFTRDFLENYGLQLVSFTSDITTPELMFGRLQFSSEPTETEYEETVASLKDNNAIIAVHPNFFTVENFEIGMSSYFYVKLNNALDYDLLRQFSEEKSVIIVEEIPYLPLWYALRCTNNTKENTLDVANSFFETELFASAVPDFISDDLMCTNDPLFNLLWGLQNILFPGLDINACGAWDITRGAGTIVSILDQGIELSHIDLNANIFPLSYDTESNSSPSKIFGDHGTHCAGTVGAIRNNNIQVVGVAPECKLMSVSNSLAGTPNSRIKRAAGINWSWKNGAAVISNSWGSAVKYDAINEAIDSALLYGRNGKGTIVVFATGNDYGGVAYPANCNPDILAVGAIQQDGLKAPFSNFGAALDIVAPGVNITSTILNNGTGSKSGTSMATPHVAGVAALILSVNPNLTQKQVANIIESTAKKIRTDVYDYNYNNISIRPNGTWNNQMGYGLVDAYAAVRAAQCFSNLPIENSIVTHNVTWNTPRQAVDVTIPNGVTLTVTSQVKCDEYSTFTVQSGGKLIIDGGTLASTCENVMWQGIKVYGNRLHSWPPGPLPHGIIEVRNGGKIENAVVGIHAINGGIVKANAAFFTNNTISAHIDFLSEANFTNTVFTVNNNYLENPLNFEAHLKLSNSELVSVSGCSFLNSLTPMNYSNVNNIGVKAFDSHLFCSSSSFTGFSTGISANNSGTTPPLNISLCSFNNSTYGTRINGVNNHQLIRNNFNLSFGTGAYITNATGYAIQENNFYGLNPIAVHSSVGLKINHSGIMENEVYKNFYDKLYAAQQFIGINATQNSLGTPNSSKLSGLQTICNSFQNSKYADIVVGGLPLEAVQQYNYIRKIQGSRLNSAGNLFYGAIVLEISNNQSLHTMDYFYNPLITNEYPTKTTNVLTYQALENTCPSKFKSESKMEEGDGEDFDNAFAKYDEWNNQYEYWFAKLLAFQGGEDDDEYKVILDNVSFFSSLKDNYWNLFITTTLNKEKIEGSKEIENKLKFENLRYLFEYRGNYTDYLSIVETYIAENNFGEARAAIERMYNLFDISDEQNAELSGLRIYINWRQELSENDNNIYSLSEKEVEYLLHYVEINLGRGVVFVKNILCALYDICSEDEVFDYYLPEEKTEEESTTNKSSLQICNKLLFDDISIAPNPTSGELKIIAGELKVDKIEVLDFVGRIVSSHYMSINQKIDISNLNSGIYLINIITEHGKIVKKVVKQ
jgi:hypothetical protein